jgi:hypothetical protein
VQFGSHCGVGMLAFRVAETASAEIARVTIMMTLRIVGGAPLGLTAGQCWLTFGSVKGCSPGLAKIVKKYPIWNACYSFFNEGGTPGL